MVRLQSLSQNAPFGRLAAVEPAGHIDSSRHVVVDVEVGVKTPCRFRLAMTILQIHRLGDRRERFDHAAVDGRQDVFHMASPDVADRLEFAAQLADDSFEQFGIEDGDRFAQRAERRSLAAEFPLDLFQLACLLQSPQ